MGLRGGLNEYAANIKKTGPKGSEKKIKCFLLLLNLLTKKVD